MHCFWFAVAIVVAAGGSAKTPKRPPAEEKKVVAPTPPPVAEKKAEPVVVNTATPEVKADPPPASASSDLKIAFKPYSAGALLGPGFMLNGGSVMMRVGGQAEAKLLQLGPDLGLELEVPLVLGFGSQTIGIAGLFESTTNYFTAELAPSAQLAFKLNEAFDAYGGFGLGPVIWWATTPVRFQGALTSTLGGAVIRITAGARFKVAEKVSVFFEPLGFHIYATGGTTTRVSGVEVRTSGGTAVMYQLALGGAYLL